MGHGSGTRPDYAREVRAALRDPRKLCAALGLDKKARRQTAGLFICCPVHGDRSPSCSVTKGPDGTVRVRCWSCDFTGDALTLVAVAKGLDLRGQFPEVLVEAAKAAGLWEVVHELQGSAAPAVRPAPAPAPPAPERTYPPASEVQALWASAGPVGDDTEASGHLVGRRIDPDVVDGLDLARVVACDASLPRWARYQGKPWTATGHRMLVRVYDADGERRSLRAWRITAGDTPKRLPPGGFKASELVLANPPGAALLRGERVSSTVVITEGEPDHLLRSTLNPDQPVLGILSGSWHQGFAERIPYGGEVIIRTHVDRAGEGYAQQVLKSVRARAHVHRVTLGGAP